MALSSFLIKTFKRIFLSMPRKKDNRHPKTKQAELLIFALDREFKKQGIENLIPDKRYLQDFLDRLDDKYKNNEKEKKETIEQTKVPYWRRKRKKSK